MLRCNQLINEKKTQQISFILPESFISLPFSLLCTPGGETREAWRHLPAMSVLFRGLDWFFSIVIILLLITGACVTPACGSEKRKQAFCSFEDRWRSPHTQCCIGMFAFCFTILICWNGWC